MIELNGIYKLKKIKGIKNNDNEYKVIKMDEKIVVCMQLNGAEKGEQFFFLKEFLIDPAKPDDIYSNIIELN